MSILLSSSAMKINKRHKLEEHLTSLRDRIPLPSNNTCKPEELTFLSLLYLITMQTFATILLFLYTLINFCTIILSLVKFFLGWLINLLQTPTKSSILIKSTVLLIEFFVLMFVLYKIASIVFVPIIGMQLSVVNQLVERDTSEKKAVWFMGGDTSKDASGDDATKEESDEDSPNKMTYEENRIPVQEKKIDAKENKIVEEFYSGYNFQDKSLIKINCGAQAFNKTHIKRKVIIFKEGMSIDDVKLLCYS
ncbi:hypothetical protein LSTR_LSTR013068 [Laodelphax striatellus]|uniref:Uncharacterized protein n=1 Tax=Laodelphax striatellus TaxID=195883 RepID=A0A482WPZ9_LAOST|nr:hypothetical protein LSTR_LSTR013068 [Laodelphax striatellus]